MRAGKTITASEVALLMIDRGWVQPHRPPNWDIFDTEFVLPTDNEVKAIIDFDTTDRQAWVDNLGDCDNFAFELRAAFGRRGWAVGVLGVQPELGEVPHAVFFYINDRREIKVIEPQTDAAYTSGFRLLAVVMY